MSLSQEIKLVEYGITTCKSDICVHVGPIARQVFIFKTSDGIEALKKHISDGGKEKSSNSFLGYAVPLQYFNDLKVVNLSAEWFANYKPDLAPEVKGDLGVKIALRMMEKGVFPLRFKGIEIPRGTPSAMQIDGIDIKVIIDLSVQVKSDERAGELIRGGSGNLFLQTHERNLFGEY